MNRLILCVAVAASASLLGCAALTQRLSAEERVAPDRSLVFGTIRLDSHFQLSEVVLERVSPGPRSEVYLTAFRRFQLFQPKLVHETAFIAPNLPPGVYRLKWIRGNMWMALYMAPEDSPPLLRFEVTEAGVYDAGAFVVNGNQLGREGQPDHASRYQILTEAVRGTQWEEGVKRLRRQMVSDAG